MRPGSLLVFQTSLNVFGSVDLLPLTGVTFPFVSNGGSAMLSAWGLLAYLKAMTPVRMPVLPSAGRQSGSWTRKPPVWRHRQRMPLKRRTVMRKIEKRAVICMALAILLAAG